MAQYYFFSGILVIGQEFCVKGVDVVNIRKDSKPKLAASLYFQDDCHKRYLCQIQQIKSRFLKLLVIKQQLIVYPKFLLYLYLPMLPKVILNQFLFQATELGIHSFYFFESEYSHKIPSDVKKEKIKISWEWICKRACENSGVTLLPKFFFCGKLELALRQLNTKKIPFCVLQKDANKEKTLPASCAELAVFVGPQRGFSKQEIEKMDCPQIALGKHWLKPQTAALSSLAIFQHLFGEFQFYLSNK